MSLLADAVQAPEQHFLAYDVRTSRFARRMKHSLVVNDPFYSKPKSYEKVVGKLAKKHGHESVMPPPPADGDVQGHLLRELFAEIAGDDHHSTLKYIHPSRKEMGDYDEEYEHMYPIWKSQSDD